MRCPNANCAECVLSQGYVRGRFHTRFIRGCSPHHRLRKSKTSGWTELAAEDVQDNDASVISDIKAKASND